MIWNFVKIILVVMITMTFVFNAGCQSDAQTGAAAGAAIGQAAGRDTKSTLIGAGVGAVGGYIIGNESDKKKAD
jgi:hypothetical protein